MILFLLSLATLIALFLATAGSSIQQQATSCGAFGPYRVWYFPLELGTKRKLEEN